MLHSVYRVSMDISVEQIGVDRERIPAWLVKIENNIGVIKYSLEENSIQKVPLSELQLAPAAYGPLPQNHLSSPENSPVNAVGDGKCPKFNNREHVEVWMPNELTNKLNVPKTCSSHESELQISNGLGSTGSLHDDGGELEKPVVNDNPSGAWWPGRILSIQNGLAHVEVAAPLNDESNSQTALGAHVVRVGPTIPFRLSVVQMEHIRKPWPGRLMPTAVISSQSTDQPPKEVASVTLMTPGVLHRHAICIPAYLSRLAASPDTHTHLVKFCGAPCLVQCAPEPFLPSMFLKRVMTGSTGEAPKPGAISTANDKAVTASPPGDSSTNPSAWSNLPHSSLTSLPLVQSVPGTLSSSGVTDPALLLEGLPGVNGPLVLLHILSGSVEAIRRASLLELAHIKLLVFRYHVLRKMSKGEPGELDLSDSIENAVENGEARFLHCKPISIPVNPTNADSDGKVSCDQQSMMIGYSAQFRIELSLIGLAIGHHGSTIQEARNLPGVRSVALLHDGIIQVEAVSVEACQAVQNLLDYTEAEVPVPPHLASRLIGSKGENVRKLAAAAGVRRAELLGPKERQRRREVAREENAVADGNVSGKGEEGGEELPQPAFYLLGTRPAVAKMRLLLDFQADNWNEMDELEEARRTLFSQLRQSNQPASRADPQTGSVSDHYRPANGAPTAGTGFGRGRWTDASHDRQPNQGPPGRSRGRGGPLMNGGIARLRPNRRQSGGSAEPESAVHNATDLNNNSAALVETDNHAKQPLATAVARNRGRGGPRRRLPPSTSSQTHNQRQTIAAFQ